MTEERTGSEAPGVEPGPDIDLHHNGGDPDPDADAAEENEE